MSRGIKRKVVAAMHVVNLEISAKSREGNRFAGALASEGYAGGYRDALNDVILLLNGVTPSTRNYWEQKPHP